MNRRLFLQGSLAVAATTVRELAGAVEGISMSASPYSAVGPFKTERKMVFEFFMFGCAYCQQYHPAIFSWGRSIPAPILFEAVPVIVDAESFRQAHAFYAVKLAMPEKLDDYVMASLRGMKSSGGSFYTEAAFLRDLGIDMRRFEKSWTGPAMKSALERANTLMNRYAITATPSIAIGGEYVLDADKVDGDYGLMMRFASGLVSRVLES